nr:Core protein [Tibet orbivirus]
MDAIAARALTVMRACVTMQEPRATLQAEVMETLGIVTTRYNGITLRGVVMRPASQEQRNDMFFMCLDMALAAANINLGIVSPHYVQHLGTLSVLAEAQIPFSVDSASKVARITGETATWGPDRQLNGFFMETADVNQPGRYFQRGGGGITTAVVNSTTIQVSLAGNARGDIQGAFQGRGDPVMIYFVWRRLATFASVQGNSQNSPQGMTLSVGGVEMRPGRVVAWDGMNPITVHNPAGAQGMISIEVVWYISLDKTLDQTSTLHSDMYNVYSYRDPTWHGLRAAILNRTTLPNVIPPIYPPSDRDDVMIITLLSALADVYTVLQPQFELFGVAPIQGPINRAIARAAYQ